MISIYQLKRFLVNRHRRGGRESGDLPTQQWEQKYELVLLIGEILHNLSTSFRTLALGRPSLECQMA